MLPTIASIAVVKTPIATPCMQRNITITHGPKSNAYPTNESATPIAPARTQRCRLPPRSTQTPVSGRVTIPAMPNTPTTNPTTHSGSPLRARGTSTSDIE